MVWDIYYFSASRYNSKMLFWSFCNQFGSDFHQPPNYWYWSQNQFQNGHFFSQFHAYNSKMLFWPFFNQFGSNFHQPPNFGHWSHSCFQNWPFFLCFTPITQKLDIANFSTDMAQIFTSSLHNLDTDHKNVLKIGHLSNFHPQNNQIFLNCEFKQGPNKIWLRYKSVSLSSWHLCTCLDTQIFKIGQLSQKLHCLPSLF